MKRADSQVYQKTNAPVAVKQLLWDEAHTDCRALTGEKNPGDEVIERRFLELVAEENHIRMIVGRVA